MHYWSDLEYRSFWQQTLPLLSKRADREDDQALQASFVELADLHGQLANRENQILFGRRGTGKTHALANLRDQLTESGEECVPMDLRTIGSAGGYYLSSEGGRRLAALRVLVDLLSELHGQLYKISMNLLNDGHPFEPLVLAMDRLADATAEISIEGVVEVSRSRLESNQMDRKGSINISTQPGVSFGEDVSEVEEYSASHKRTGTVRPAMNIGLLHGAMRDVVAALPRQRLWVLIDEWSALPLDIQPFIADFLRRVILPCRGLILKVAAVERRSKFWHQTAEGYVGFELGSDIFTGLDIDAYITEMLIPRHAQMDFYRTLLTKHAQEIAREYHLYSDFEGFLGVLAIPEYLPAFRDAVYFAGGNPRDLLTIVSLAANDSSGLSQIDFDGIARAARKFYIQAKESQARLLPSTRKLSAALHDFAAARGRRFLVKHHYANDAIYDLLDQRIVHLLDRSVGPGGDYDIYAIDLGTCADVLADDGLLRESETPWSNWDQVKTRHKTAPVLEFDGHLVRWSSDVART